MSKYYSIRTKLIAFMLIATTIPLLASISMTFIQTKTALREQAVAENKRLIFQASTNLNNYVDNVARASLAVYNDPNFLRNLAKIPGDYRAVAEVYTTLQTIRSAVPDVFQLYLHSFAANQSTLIANPFPKREERKQAYSDSLHGKSNDKSPDIWVESAHLSHSYGFKAASADDPPRKVITLHRVIKDVPSTERLGVLAIDLNMDTIAEICSRLYDPTKEQIYVIDNKNQIIFEGKSEVSGTDALRQEAATELNSARSGEGTVQTASGHFEQDHSMYVYQQLGSQFADWTIVKQIPNETLYASATTLTWNNAMIAIAALLLVIVATLFISIRITGPLKQLMRYMNQIQAGRLHVDIRLTSGDEIGVLARHFRDMMDTVNNLILREYRLEIANKTNQLKALQAQIHPHFLYNTLQSIGTLALQQQGQRVYVLLSSLSKMLRYSMRDQTRVTLNEEAEHARLYLELQKERFGDRLEVELDFAEDTLRAEMPRMTLQPLIENYFKHGADVQPGKGRIRISSQRTPDDWIQIRLENNGPCIPEDKLSEIQRWLHPASISSDSSQEPDETESIGLRNVMRRLQLNSPPGYNATLTIGNLEPNGVEIIVKIYAGE
ncbi:MULTISPECIES: cache domain-containing sensor histidine kinase [unclassified Paenibacillus]|uniref:cache domain-containing sensor histidine kinase n=1 Tax=unclassified Paenibacillus TaxID=185978 RepID=UPI0009A755D6|nr:MULTISPECIES: sensor histidine kinase [unclassified Paenibacillus]SLK08151.1 two-component system, sensor histidine kinase YesM [Paenibacillus sp. RU5A]SOC70932.1 two-component system, sensor histidine kinase YesM [Paenibacillus sp. RU26A]SOC73396.1 two-component system, sensor histidine kinase YesM [Paenibacillus sp. RU5M]